jgi:hypothetical protein
VPYVLRLCSQNHVCDRHGKDYQSGTSDKYYFLGECYVDELMSGDFADSEAVVEREIIVV